MVSSGESWLIVMYWRFMMITGGIYPLVISHSNWNWPFSSLFCLLDMVIFHNYVSVPGDTHLFCKVFDEGKTTFVIVKWTELEGSIARVRDSLKKYCCIPLHSGPSQPIFTLVWYFIPFTGCIPIFVSEYHSWWFWRSQRQTPKCLAKMHFFAGKATSWSSIFIIFQQANTTSQIVRNCGSKFRYSIHHQQKNIIFWVSFTSPLPPCPTSSGEFPADRLPILHPVSPIFLVDIPMLVVDVHHSVGIIPIEETKKLWYNPIFKYFSSIWRWHRIFCW